MDILNKVMERLGQSVLKEVLGKVDIGGQPRAFKPEIIEMKAREQWRFPRSKKKRIRKKWRNQDRNWRPITGPCLHVKGTNKFYVTSDVYRQLLEGGYLDG